MKNDILPMNVSNVYFLFSYNEYVKVNVVGGEVYNEFDDIPVDVLFNYRICNIDIDMTGEITINCTNI